MTRSLFLTLALPLVSALPAYPEEVNHRIITVSGTATVRYAPDAARIQFRIRNSEATWDDVRQANQKALKLVDEKVSALKVKDLKITFSPMSVSQPTLGRIRGGGGGAPVAEARSVSSTQLVTLVVREADLDRLTESIGKIEKTLFDAGFVNGPAVDDDLPARASNLSVAMFRRDEAEFRDEALTKAVQNAMQKAKALARGAGVQIKETVSILEHEATPPELPTRPLRNGPSGPGGFGGQALPTVTTQPATGELAVTVRVTVKCSY